MREVISVLQSGLATLHRLDEAVFLGEVTRHDISDNFARIAAVFARSLRQAGLKIGSEVNFHTVTIR